MIVYINIIFVFFLFTAFLACLLTAPHLRPNRGRVNWFSIVSEIFISPSSAPLTSETTFTHTHTHIHVYLLHPASASVVQQQTSLRLTSSYLYLLSLLLLRWRRMRAEVCPPYNDGTGYHSSDGDEGIRNKKKCDLGYFPPYNPLHHPLNPARSARPLVDERGDVQAPQMPSGGVALTVVG